MNFLKYGIFLMIPGCILGSYHKAPKRSYEFYTKEVPESKILYKIRFDGIYYYKLTEKDIHEYHKWNDSMDNWRPQYKYLRFTPHGQVNEADYVMEGPDEKWTTGGYSTGYYTIIKDTIFFSTKQAATDPEALIKAYFIKDTLVTHTYMTKSIRKRMPCNVLKKYVFFKNTTRNF